MAGKMVPDEIGGGPEEADLIKAFGFYCLCVTDFKWVGEQDPIYSFKGLSGYCVDVHCSRKRRNKEMWC